MNKRQIEFIDFLKNVDEKEGLSVELSKVETNLATLDYLLTVADDKLEVKKANSLLKTIHSNYLQKLRLEMQINSLERKILQFQIAAEVAE